MSQGARQGSRQPARHLQLAFQISPCGVLQAALQLRLQPAGREVQGLLPFSPSFVSKVLSLACPKADRGHLCTLALVDVGALPLWILLLDCHPGKKRGEGIFSRDEDFMSKFPVFLEGLALFKALILPPRRILKLAGQLEEP